MRIRFHNNGEIPTSPPSLIWKLRKLRDESSMGKEIWYSENGRTERMKYADLHTEEESMEITFLYIYLSRHCMSVVSVRMSRATTP